MSSAPARLVPVRSSLCRLQLSSTRFDRFAPARFAPGVKIAGSQSRPTTAREPTARSEAAVGVKVVPLAMTDVVEPHATDRMRPDVSDTRSL